MTLNETILRRSEELFEYMQKIRREIHMHPEPGFQEFNTSGIICENLDKLGIPYKSGFAQTGVVALIEGRGPGKVIGLRADMDALSLFEENDVPYKSKREGFMHACGHDAHVATLLGAATVLNENRDKFDGAVKLFFQPAEEGPGGAEPMIEEGCMENPHVDAVIAFHVGNGYKTGLIGIHGGPTHAAQNELRITITGKGGHAATPEKGIDAIVIAAHAITALQTVVSRSIDPLDPAVLTIGTIKGGTRLNIIAEQVELSGTIRYLKDSVGEKIHEAIRRVMDGVTKAFGGTYKIEILEGYPAVYNDSDLAEKLKGWVIDLLGPKGHFVVDRPTMGAEDFAYFARKVPSVFMRLGVGGDDPSVYYNHHSSRFDIDEKGMINGCAGFAKMAIEFLNDKGE
ncbi:MAG: amidohydrolase [Firmicutes bacterium]|nr:amidohydrolase [Bacillota bacterium]